MNGACVWGIPRVSSSVVSVLVVSVVVGSSNSNCSTYFLCMIITLFDKIRCMVPVWHTFKVEAVSIQLRISPRKWLTFNTNMHACAQEGGIPVAKRSEQ